MSVEKILKLVDGARHFTLEEEQGKIAQSSKPTSPVWELPAPITDEEFNNAKAAPQCIVENLLYADVGLLIAPGGTGKTTLILYIAIHIILGLSLFGLRIFKTGPVLIITAEDGREMLVARLRAIANAMELNEAERAKIIQGVMLSDVSGSSFRLTKIQSDVVKPSAGVDEVIRGCQTRRPVLVVIDPAISFGVGESRVNDAEQGLIEVGRRLRKALECCVLYIHHSGKKNAHDRAKDQYAGRGGSAFADGSRMVLVLQNVSLGEWCAETGKNLEKGETGLVLSRPKMSYCPPQDEILINRSGYRFAHFDQARPTEAVKQEKADDTIFEFLTTQLVAEHYHTKSTLEASDLRLRRSEIREAIDRLLKSGRVEHQNIPAAGKARRGGARTYLHPVPPPLKYGEHRS